MDDSIGPRVIADLPEIGVDERIKAWEGNFEPCPDLWYGKPAFQLKPNPTEFIKRVWDWLAGIEKPHTFMMPGGPARLYQTPDGHYRVRPLTASGMVQWLHENAAILRWGGKGGFREVRLPKEDAEALLNGISYQGNLPVLNKFVHYPFFDVDGNLVSETGYCPKSKVFLSLADYKQEPLPKKITRDHVEEWKNMFFDTLLRDFPWGDESALTQSLMLGLWPLVQFFKPFMLCPLHVIEGPDKDTGKTTLIDFLSLAITGRTAGVAQWDPKPEELTKQLVVYLQQGYTHLCIDNLPDRRMFESNFLEQTLTRRDGMWSTRMLGKNDTGALLQGKNDVAWSATGLNPTMSGPLQSRSISIRFGPARVNGKRRALNSYYYPMFGGTEQILKDRPQLTRAGCGLVAYWIQEGAMGDIERSEHRAEAYGYWMGGLAKSIGCEGFLANVPAAEMRMDERGQDVLAFVDAWWHRQRWDSTWAKVGIKPLIGLCREKDLLPFESAGEGAPSKLGTMLTHKIGSNFLVEDTEGKWEVSMIKHPRGGDGWKYSLVGKKLDDQVGLDLGARQPGDDDDALW